MLVDLCQTLLKRGMDQEAKGVWLRNNLALNAPPDLEAEIKRIAYQPNLDKQPEDTFGPITNVNCFRLPKKVKVHFVGLESEVPKI
jgi:hypothetical protein